MEEVTRLLKEKTFAFFEKNEIKLPIEIKNDIEDVFDENDFTSDEEDVINIYFKEDLEDFETDTKIINQLNVQVTGGNSSGYIIDKYTYCGNLITNNAYDEDIGLYDGEEQVNQVSKIEATTLNHLEDPTDYCVVVLVVHDFAMGEYTVTPKLYIYIPESGENID